MHEPFEQELRERFASLRAEVDGATPPFAVPGIRRPTRKVTVVWAAAAVVLLAAIGTWAVTSRGKPQTPYAFDLSATTWEAPTDFLLVTPGSGMLDSIPAIEIGLPTIVEPAQQEIDTSI